MRVAQLRQVAEREVDLAVVERRAHGIGIELDRLDSHARRRAADLRHQRRQQLAGREVAHVDDELALRHGGVERDRFAQRDLERLQRRIDESGEVIGPRGRRHAAGAAPEQRVLQRQAQPRQRVAHRRLRELQPLRGAADVARRVDGAEHVQQVEIQVRRYSCHA